MYLRLPRVSSSSTSFLACDCLPETASAPANADNVTFVGESYMMGQKVKTRETMTKKGPKEVEHKFEADMGKGFQVIGTDVCKK